MRLWLALLLLILAPLAALAQPASLVADRVFIEGDRRLIAEGSVEVLFEDARLTATRIIYDQTNETLQIEGPLVLSEKGDETVVLASQAQLDATLEKGILTSARIVLDRQLQLAASEMARVAGRFSRLSRVTASSCYVCEDGGPPLWEIRARQVIRDEQERQLYFDEAQLRVAGVPVFYIPRLRLPDPTLERATGVLVPRFRTRSQLGTGILVPYFVKIGDHADVTVTPYISNKTVTLEGRYRQEFRNGRLSFDTAISRDDIVPGETRGYFFGEGEINLPDGFVLDFDLELVSDDSYLSDYGYSDADRLDSGVYLTRTRDEQLVFGGLTSFRTLRASEQPTERELPNELVELRIRQLLAEDPVWGQLWTFGDIAALARPSQDDGVGRDVSRIGAGLDWWTSANFGPFVADAEAEAAFEAYAVDQDSNFDSSLQRTRLGAAVTLRLPLERQESYGARQLLEPMVQLAWGETSGDAVPNEDSEVVEFDEGNLLSLSRFPGIDRYEEGTRLNYGVRWTRYDPAGWSIGLTVGRVYRFDDTLQFGGDTGLSGTSSDWLLATQYKLGDTLALSNRSLIDDSLNVTSAETRLAWNNDLASLAGTHLWRSAAPLEGRDGDLSELTLDGSYWINDLWKTSAEWRYDADSGATTRAGVGVTFENECLRVDLSLSRRFTSSTNVEPATELDLRIALTGFGTGGEARRVRHRCSG
ncbi:MAG: LPS assembly protein LptD [Pseudomonadota bacterium]